MSQQVALFLLIFRGFFLVLTSTCPQPLPVGFISSLYALELSLGFPLIQHSPATLGGEFKCPVEWVTRGTFSVCWQVQTLPSQLATGPFPLSPSFPSQNLPSQVCCVLKHFFLSSLTSSPTCYFWSQLLSKLPTRQRSEPLLFYLGKGEV